MPEEAIRPPRSWLFAPGHDEKLLRKVFDAGADLVLLDLEDAVPLDKKDRAREMVAEVAGSRACWVRVNRARSELCARDLDALAGSPLGLRIPKAESPEKVACAPHPAPGLPLNSPSDAPPAVLPP